MPAPKIIEVPDDDIGRWHWATRRATAPLVRWLRVEMIDAHNVAPDGGVLLAANHLSFLDSLLLLHALPRRITLLGKVEYLSRRSTRRLFPRAGMIPVDRSGRGVGQSMARAEARLRAGELLGIFPEGTRSRDGRLHRGHSGVAHLALKTGCPIVPVGIVGTEVIMAPGQRIPHRRTPVSLRFAPPVDLGRWAEARPTASTKQEITDEVMAAIAGLTGQERADGFARSPDLAPAGSAVRAGTFDSA